MIQEITEYDGKLADSFIVEVETRVNDAAQPERFVSSVYRVYIDTTQQLIRDGKVGAICTRATYDEAEAFLDGAAYILNRSFMQAIKRR